MPSTLRLQAATPGDIERAAAILREGGLVAFPTETVYGLGGNALSSDAVANIFTAKQRPGWDPLIVHVAAFQHLSALTFIPGALEDRVGRLAGRLWPGPLTMLLPRTAACPDAVTAGRSTVGVRIPAHSVAQALLRTAGVPVAAPSANRFGHVSPTTAQHVLDDLDGRIDAVLDGGPTTVGVESTVLDPAPTPMVVYRAGAVTIEELARVAGAPALLFRPAPPAERQSGEPEPPPESLPSPGVGMRHYAPGVPLLLTEGNAAALQGAVRAAAGVGERVCVLLPDNWPSMKSERIQEIRWGRWDAPDTLAASLFGALRLGEASGASILCCPLPEPGGLRDALRDRLQKAARPK